MQPTNQIYGLSIIVPTFNEQDNVQSLLQRIDDTLRTSTIPYEVVFVDDHSTDATCENIHKLSASYPAQLYLKQGKKGKAYSILEGVTHAKYDTVAMIDADLQYPPEALVPMIQIMQNGADVVITSREKRNGETLRQITSRAFAYFFCTLLHNLPFDVQSGLKMFRREIFERVQINPTPWTFDMEFLLKARSAGYRFASYDITFAERAAGYSKVNVVHSAIEIGMNALKLKFTDAQPIPFSKNVRDTEGHGFHFQSQKYMTYGQLHPSDSALRNFTTAQKILIADAVALFLAFLVFNWHATIVISIAMLTVIYLADLMFTIYVMYLGVRREEPKPEDIATTDLPLYTVLCPLYKEWQVIPQFIRAMQDLEYPKDKLQVLLLLEENDKKTLEKVRTFSLPEYFEVLVVPDSKPKTKPKACNYGLQHAKGKYTVIYDAEDIPEPKQLLKAVEKFRVAPENVICLQAKLNYFNPHQNMLTRFFTAEYSLWFDLILPGLQKLNAPIPLGGTSNHFITEKLLHLPGWDVFNVTEDCDLGVRLYKNGHQTWIINSTTLEEANSDILNWINQRSRWIKGYMQTYLVHMRNPQKFVKQMGWRGFLIFQLTVGGKVATVLINPLLWIITATYFIFRPILGTLIESFFPSPVFYFGFICFLFGNFLYLYSYMFAAASRRHYDIVKYGYFIPFYWILMSIASWKSLQSLIFTPHYWAKTIHGFHLQPTQQKQPKSYDIPNVHPIPVNNSDRLAWLYQK